MKRLNRKVEKEFVPLDQLAKEAKINYSGLQGLSYAKVIGYNFKKLDTMPKFIVKWDKNMNSKDKSNQQKKLGEWLKYKLNLKSLLIEN